MNRRMMLASAAATAAAPGAEEPIPIIDTHFHLYDQTRPQGAPFPFTPNNPPFLPKDFRASAIPLGVVGGIKVEASPWVEDNLWVLMIIESEPMIVGMVGNLDPVKPEFREYLDRYRRNKLFLGIRYGNVWKEHNLVTAVENPDFVANMKAFAATGLTLEVANPRLDLIEATLKLADKVPDLRIVIGHLQALPLPTGASVLTGYRRNLEQLRRQGAFVKISGLPRLSANPPVAGAPLPEPSAYRPALDFLWDIFGEDKVVYAGRNARALGVLRDHAMARGGRPAAEKFLWKNSLPAFRWIHRDPKQPRA